MVQECGTGLVTIKQTETGLAFAAPPLLREGPVEDEVAGGSTVTCISGTVEI